MAGIKNSFTVIKETVSFLDTFLFFTPFVTAWLGWTRGDRGFILLQSWLDVVMGGKA
jgi:hypothetical protein